jgi:dCTP deaminase
MILSNDGIKKALASRALEITPAPDETQYTTSAVDLHLGSEFNVWDTTKLDVPGVKVELDLSIQRFNDTAKAYIIPVKKEDDGSVIFPPYRVRQSHMLAITKERIHLNREHRLAARVEGRSGLARLGMIIHLTAPTVHAGWSGPIALEMINFSPFYLKLVPNKTRICQLIVERLESDPTIEINTKFQGQTLPTGEKK